MITLGNKHKIIDDGVNNIVNIGQSNIYERERESGKNLRLMFNIGVVCDGSLFNPVTEYIKDGKIHIGGITKISEQGLKVSDIESSDMMTGVDMMNALAIRCYDQPYITDQFDGFELENTNRAYKRSIESSANTAPDAPWYSQFKHNTTQWYNDPTDDRRMNNETIFAFGKYMSFGTSVNKRLRENGGEYGFINPVSLVDTLSNSRDTVGLISDVSGKFISMYPTKDHYTFHDVYNKYNKCIEPNWHARITYPYKNFYSEDFFRTLHEKEVSSQGIRHGLIIWALDESMGKQRTFRTICKNGFMVGDIVSIYNNDSNNVPQKIYDSLEVIAKPDDYSFTVSVETNPICEWTYSAEVSFDVNDHKTDYFKINGGVGCLYTFINEDNEEVVVTGTTTYNNSLTVVRVENFVECDYYIKMLKDTGAKLISKRNSFSHNIYGINNGYLITQDDIDMSLYTDNLGRPLNDLYLTIVKDNTGYEKWYNGNDDECQNDADVSHSHCFGPITGGYRLDSLLNLPDDVRNISLGHGHPVKLDNGNGEFYEGEYMGDICEYSPSVFLEHTLQPFEHRFNTAQRDCVNGNIELIINDISFAVGAKSLNKQRYKPYAAGVNEYTIRLNSIKNDLSVGYVYKPHRRISVRTIKRDLTSIEAESYRTVRCSSGVTQMISYGNMTSEEAVYNITLNMSNKMQLMAPVMLYFKSKKGVMYDMSFNAKFIAWHEDTLISVILDNKDDMDVCNEYVTKTFGEGKEFDLFVIVANNSVPSYASFISDNGFYYRWRDIVTNGTDGDDSGRVYPFTNGAFYIENNLSIYLMKQRDIIYDELDDEGYPVWPEDYTKVIYTPRTIKVEEVNKKYDDGNNVKEIEECGDIKI